MADLWILFWSFTRIGCFTFGGGLATLPFLYNLAEKYPWFKATILPDMIAISESTPGPIGVNMATYVTALIATSGFEVLKVSVFTLSRFQLSHQPLDLFDLNALILFIIFYFIITKSKLHPIIFIVCGALIGIFSLYNYTPTTLFSIETSYMLIMFCFTIILSPSMVYVPS